MNPNLVLLCWIAFFLCITAVALLLIAKDGRQKGVVPSVPPPDLKWDKKIKEVKRDEYEELDPDGLADEFNNLLSDRGGDTSDRGNDRGD